MQALQGAFIARWCVLQAGADAAMEEDSADASVPSISPNTLPEVELYAYLLVLIYLLDRKQYKQVGGLCPGCDCNLCYAVPWTAYSLQSSMPTHQSSREICCVTCMQARDVADSAVERLKDFNRRTLDVIGARIYFYYSWAYECTDAIADIRRYVYTGVRVHGSFPSALLQLHYLRCSNCLCSYAVATDCC